MEVLGLTWANVDFEHGLVRLGQQLSRVTRTRKSLKTKAGKRNVILAPSLAKMLKAHRLASRFTGPDDYVFCTPEERPLTPSNVDRRALHAAAEKAALRKPRPKWHDLRHSFASAMIQAGADVVFLAAQLGHANPSITLSIYAHEFAQAQHGDKMRGLLEGQFAGAFDGKEMVSTDGNGQAAVASVTPQEPALLHAVGTSGNA